jgi:alpha-L-fucosidase
MQRKLIRWWTLSLSRSWLLSSSSSLSLVVNTTFKVVSVGVCLLLAVTEYADGTVSVTKLLPSDTGEDSREIWI